MLVLKANDVYVRIGWITNLFRASLFFRLGSFCRSMRICSRTRTSLGSFLVISTCWLKINPLSRVIPKYLISCLQRSSLLPIDRLESLLSPVDQKYLIFRCASFNFAHHSEMMLATACYVLGLRRLRTMLLPCSVVSEWLRCRWGSTLDTRVFLEKCSSILDLRQRESIGLFSSVGVLA